MWNDHKRSKELDIIEKILLDKISEDELKKIMQTQPKPIEEKKEEETVKTFNKELK